MKKLERKLSIIILITLTLLGCKDDTDNSTSSEVIPPPTISYSVIGEYPHDTSSFTEGLLISDGRIYESTGGTKELSQTKSLFGVLDTVTGKIKTKVELNKDAYFGEGITILKDKIYQLTYKSRTGFVYNAKTYKKIKEFSIPSEEGWGITTDGSSLIMSDGTNVLTFLNPENLAVEKKLSVTENGYAQDNLNELEYINGFIFANVWQTNTIVKIDLSTGEIKAKLDLTALYQKAKYIYPWALEMNGIAFDPTTNDILITGKLWPKLYKIRLEE